MNTPALPRRARLPINRCNLPADILGGLLYQRHPLPLDLDGIAALHPHLFTTLADLDTSAARAARFHEYMTANFRLDNLAEAGLGPRSGRARADYLHLLRGWHFNPDGREAAVLRGWVESRFGLLARHHDGTLHDEACDAYLRYIAARASGLYNTNALEAQLDLLYTYAQYELHLPRDAPQHLRLYRGVNRPWEHDCVERLAKRRAVLLLNNLSSFTRDRDRAGEFGDYILEADIPLPKILFQPGLLPGLLTGEEEYVVIGGLCEVEISY